MAHPTRIQRGAAVRRSALWLAIIPLCGLLGCAPEAVAPPGGGIGNLLSGDSIVLPAGLSSDLVVTTAALDFGADRDELMFAFRNLSGQPLEYLIRSDAPWVTAKEAKGVAIDQVVHVTVRVNRLWLSAGSHDATLVLEIPSRTPVHIAVRAFVDTDPIADPAEPSVPSDSGSGDDAPSETYSITGRVRDGGFGVAGVAVSAIEGGSTDVTDSTGLYRVSVPSNWSGNVAARHDGYQIDPAVHEFQAVNSDYDHQDFKAIPMFPEPLTLRISGQVRWGETGLAGLPVRATNGGASTVTDYDGRYVVEIPNNWWGLVITEHVDYSFTPSARPHVGVRSDLEHQDFSATLRIPESLTRTISGRVRSGQSGVAEAFVAASPDGTAFTTDANGDYWVEVPVDWSGVVTVTHPEFFFTRTSRSYSGLAEDRAGQDFAATPVGDVSPVVGIKASSGTWRVYTVGEQTVFDDDLVTADVRVVGNFQWELRLTAKVQLSNVSFPYDPTPRSLNADPSDDVLFMPYFLGTALKADVLSEEVWSGPLYPGKAFAPLAVIADDTDARLVAATNWPPRAVRVGYRRDRLSLGYSDVERDTIEPNESRTFGALVVRCSGDPESRKTPWQVALDLYNDWLRERMASEGLYPVAYPEWQRREHGWIHVNLHWFTTYPPDFVPRLWSHWKHLLPHVQFWGQMSEYTAASGACCRESIPIHARYLPELVDTVHAITLEGQVSFYSRPREPWGPIDGRTPESRDNLAFLLEWLDSNTRINGATTAYLDVLGGRHFGDPLTIARFFETHFPPGSVIESAVDVYPTAFLISGSLRGGLGEVFKGGPGFTDRAEVLSETTPKITFPRFGRYLLGDRIVYLGESNHDNLFWGRSASYWTERQAFLLGAKFDAIHVSEDWQDLSVLDRALELSIAERERVNWWQREPVYLDRAGVHDVPAGIDVRRFVDRDGVDLFAIDNWQLQPNLTFGFNGAPVPVPQQQLAIVEILTQ